MPSAAKHLALRAELNSLDDVFMRVCGKDASCNGVPETRGEIARCRGGKIAGGVELRGPYGAFVADETKKEGEERSERGKLVM